MRILIHDAKKRQSLCAAALQQPKCLQKSQVRCLGWCTEKPGKPDPPVVTSTAKSTVSLSYKPPADDGGAAITNYVLEHREDGLATWTRATKDTINKTSYTVTGLTVGATYEFRVSAENKAGVGPPSEPSEPAAAKETVCKD